MCGILGFIGKSQNPRASFELANALLVRTEIRGDHATGFWSCERGDGRVFFDKEPIKSSVYANRDIWKNQFASTDADLLIAHCRYTSMNVGHEKFNKNNHPHVSADRRIALVHNGRIPEYGALKGRYDLHSDCDSEILLSMFEHGESFKNKEDFLKQEFPNLTPDVAYRMMGLKEVFSRVNYGAMAVAIGERAENSTGRFLWMFRDEERPLHVVDMRKTLGQIFFCSTAEIWKHAVEQTPIIKQYIPDNLRIIEFPANQVWMLETEQSEDPTADTWLVKKFRITKTKFYDWKQEDEHDAKVSRVKSSKTVNVVSRLDGGEEVKVEHKEVKTEHKNDGPVPHLLPVKVETIVNAPVDRKKRTKVTGAAYDQEDDVDDNFLARQAASNKDAALESLTPTNIEPQEIDMDSFEKMIKELRELVNDIDTNVKNMEKDQSLSTKDFSIIMDSLKDAQAELKGSIIFLK